LGSLVELSILGKATLILVIGLTIVMLSRRARASVRHLLLAATLAAVFALPLIVLAVPEVTIGVLPAQASQATDLKPAAPLVELTAPTVTSLPSQATENAPWSLPSWLTIVRIVWLAGAFLLLALLAVDLRRLYRMRREGLLWMESRELIQWLARECGVRRKVEVLLHEGIPGPLTFGLWRPVILLPDEACEWKEADLRRALVHELEHVRRGDWAIQFAARATCIFYWFHPLVWVALRWLSLAAERAADDAVVQSAEHTEYAEQLVLLAGRLSNARTQPALGMANRSDLSARVSALLDASQRRGRAGWRAVAIALSVAGLVVLTLAPVRAVTQAGKQTAAAAQTPDSQSDTTGKKSAPARAEVRWKVSTKAPDSQSNTTGKEYKLKNVTSRYPKVIKGATPRYPADAKAAGVSGAVSVRVLISEEGKVIEAEAVSGHQLLREAAVEAAKQYVFSPTEKSGVPVKVKGIITFNFNEKRNEKRSFGVNIKIQQ
jgi:TonB family protein